MVNTNTSGLPSWVQASHSQQLWEDEMPEFTPLSSFTGRAREVFSYLVWQAGLHDFEVAWRDEPKIGDRARPQRHRVATTAVRIFTAEV